MSKGARIKSFDFVRAVCAIGIVLNHFAAHSESEALKRFLYTFPSGYGSFGYTLVTVFFLISGGLLYLNHDKVDDLRRFYVRRWWAIYPSYYLAYVAALVMAVALTNDFFADKKLYQLVYTIIGFDGYIGSQFQTWRLVGEWFIGAIILCYIAYPFLLKAFNRSEGLTLAVFAVLYALTFNWQMLSQHPFRNVFSCLLSFLLGMSIFKHALYRDRRITWASLVVLVSLYVLPVPVPDNLSAHLCGVALFFVLNAVGEVVMGSRVAEQVINWLAGISYEIFLVHHLTIRAVLLVLHPSDAIGTSLALLVSLTLSILLAKALSVVSRTTSGLVRQHLSGLRAE